MSKVASAIKVKKSIIKNCNTFGKFAHDLKALSIGFYKDCNSCGLCINGHKSIEFAIQYLILTDLEIVEHGYLQKHAPEKWATVLHDLYIFSIQIRFKLTPIERVIYKDFFKTCNVFAPRKKRRLKIYKFCMN